MAAHTDRLRRTKRSTDMTSLTGHIRMGAVEHESCAEMIKRLLRGCNEANHRSDQQYGDQKQPESDRFGWASSLPSE